MGTKWIWGLMLIFITCTPRQEPPWIALFDGSSLDAWELKNGTASFQIEGDEIVGTTKMDSPNSFLCTKKSYSDFIFEFEVKVDPAVNSGVQFRSNSRPGYKKGQVHGYQAEIDPSKRAWSGGIYEEGRRGWLYDLKDNPDGRNAFENRTWNKYRIEAIGDHLMIWINGVNTANLKDGLTQKGFIGLQVHSIGDSNQAGKKIRWRNLRIITVDPSLYSQRSDLTAPLKATE